MLVPFYPPITIGELHKKFTLGQGIITSPDTEVNGFTVNSATVKPGCLFIACRGLGKDGHEFIDQAFQAGAAATVVADIERLNGRPGFESSNARVLVSRLSNHAYGQPSKKLTTIGITGTNGKTTTNWLLYHALNKLHKKCIRIGTLGYEIDQQNRSDDSLTTPVPEQLHNLLDLAVRENCSHAVLEVSSHALHQHRVDDLAFDAAVFTNITHDHLDYHHTFEEYFQAKRRLFELMLASSKTPRVFSVNLESDMGQRIAAEFDGKIEINASFSYKPSSAVFIKKVETKSDCSLFSYEVFGEKLEFTAPFFGMHNAENLAASIGVLSGLGFKVSQLEEALSAIPPVPGRLEIVPNPVARCFVDYAHSPDSLERILISVKSLPHSRIILVFGCGGSRDWRKRSVMGNIAAKLADYSVVTSDNPRKEDPERIISDILESNLNPGHNCEVVTDRASAIRRAMQLAGKDDIILVAGKGHETYQIIGEEKLHFSDQEQILSYKDS